MRMVKNNIYALFIVWGLTLIVGYIMIGYKEAQVKTPQQDYRQATLQVSPSDTQPTPASYEDEYTPAMAIQQVDYSKQTTWNSRFIQGGK